MNAVKFTPAGAIVGVVLASAVATAGFVLAVTADGLGWRIAGALLAAEAVFGMFSLLRRSSATAVRVGAVVVPVLLLAVGVPVAAGLHSSERIASDRLAGAPPPDGDVTRRLPRDPNARLRDALAEADRLLPGGSGSLLDVDLSANSTRVRVYDRATGDEISAHESTGTWFPSTRRRATDRRFFARSDVDRLDLAAATVRVREVARRLRLDPTAAHPADGIEIKRRTDDLLVAGYTVAFRPIEVDMAGRVAETVGAGFLDTALETAAQSMRTAGLDPNAPTLRRVAFRAFTDGSSSVAASAVQNSGGVALDFSAGPLASMKIVPGCFPSSAPRTSRESDGFALTAVSAETLARVRDDLLARHDLPPFDGDLIAFEIGSAPGSRGDGPVLRLRVGPASQHGEGVYTLDGDFLRSGTW